MTSMKMNGAGSRPTNGRGAWLLRSAAVVDRAVTWGLEPDEREELLAERAADRYEHLADPGASLPSVFVRSLRSAFADVWFRLVGGDISAFPVAAMFALLGLGALSDTVTSKMPLSVVAFNLLTAIGFMMMAVAGFIRPRELKRVWLLPGAVLASVGTIGGAVLLPVTEHAALFDWLNKLSLGGAAVGLAVIAASLLPRMPKRVWFLNGGVILWSSAFVFAVGQFGWAIFATPVYSTRGSTLMVAVVAVIGAAVLSRLRYLPIAS